MRLTLDTSIVIDAVAGSGSQRGAAVLQLVDFACAKRVELYLAQAFEADQTRATTSVKRRNLEWLSKQSITPNIPGAFRIGYSALNGGDVLVTEEQALALRRIDEILGVGQRMVGHDNLAPPNRIKNLDDSQHLGAHWMAGHDAFVTSDGLLLARQALFGDALGLHIWDAEKALGAVQNCRGSGS